MTAGANWLHIYRIVSEEEKGSGEKSLLVCTDKKLDELRQGSAFLMSEIVFAYL